MTDYQGVPLNKQAFPKKIVFHHYLAPGDVLVMSAALASLHLQFPGQYLTEVDCSHPDLYLHNPYVTKVPRHEAWFARVEYPLIEQANKGRWHFMHGFVSNFKSHLGIDLQLQVSRPEVYLSDEERQAPPLVPGRYWLINAGTKTDHPLKAYPFYQDVVDRLRGKIRFVQIGRGQDRHKPLEGVLNFIGKTNIRELIRLCLHADGGLGPTTFLQHLSAALGKPYVCVAGAREPLSWLAYPTQTTFSTQGRISCGTPDACWKNIAHASHGFGKMCLKPKNVNGQWVGECMSMIHPADIANAILDYYLGGVLV